MIIAVVRRLLIVLMTVGALVLTSCGSPQEAPQTQTGAQESLPPPVLAESGEPSTPARLTVDGATAPTQTVDTDDDGVLLPPIDVQQLGWWVGSAQPGSGAGTIVITGHVDDVEQGDGFAARFADLEADDAVAVTTADGSVHRYRVTEAAAVNKEGGLPVGELNRLDGPETLALVTCGGPFVGPPLGYRDNIVVFAVPEEY